MGTLGRWYDTPLNPVYLLVSGVGAGDRLQGHPSVSVLVEWSFHSLDRIFT